MQTVGRYFIIFVFLLIFTEGRSQIDLINTGATSVLSIPSIIGNNILINGNINYLSKSYDECDNFTPLTIPGYPGNTNFYQRLNPNLLFAFSADFNNYDFKIFKSLDDGQSWVSVFDSVGGGTFFSHYAFFDANEGIVLGTFNQMARTKNGGASWLPGGNHNQIVVSAIKVYGDSMFCVGGGLANFLVSKDRGNTWVGGGGFGAQATVTDFSFLNKDSIFVIGVPGAFQYNFAKSFNGGKTWAYNSIYNPTIRPFGLCLKSKDEIYAVGAGSGSIGIILKTTDMGETWSGFKTGIKSELINMRFLNDSIALVSGSNGVLFKWNSKTAVFTSLTVGLHQNALADLALGTFPNPVTDKLRFQFDSLLPEELNLKISNTLGEMVYSEANIDLTKDLNLDFLRSGVYYLELESQGSQRIFKVLKE